MRCFRDQMITFEHLRVPKPQKYVNNSLKPLIIAIKAIMSHTFGPGRTQKGLRLLDQGLALGLQT